VFVARLKRQMISIDEERSDGCGCCLPACAEGAFQIVGGKARRIKESCCDGLVRSGKEIPFDNLMVPLAAQPGF
jgi:Fe-S-cluster-containing hydrogenase component 2